MGIRSRIKGALKRVRVLTKVIHEESKYPGRPQPHMASKNPLWGGGETSKDSSTEDETKDKTKDETKDETKEQVAQKTGITQENKQKNTETEVFAKTEEESSTKGSLDEEGADYWFLKYDDVEGWNESNPGQKKD